MRNLILAVLGTGLEIARHLAARKIIKLILAVRNEQSGLDAKGAICAGLPKGHTTDIQIWRIDMASFASVREFAKRSDALERLDAVAMNAGMFGGGANGNDARWT